MKLTKILVDPQGLSAGMELSFKDPSGANPFNVKGITGLDADDITPRFYNGFSTGSAKFYNLAMEKREVVMRIGLNPRFELGESYSSLRDQVYKMIASTRTGQVDLSFYNGSSYIAGTSGFVKKVEAPQFEKTQEVVVTVECNDGLLRGDRRSVNVAGLNPAATHIVDDVSTAPHGCEFTIQVLTAVSSLFITDPNMSNWYFGVTPPGGFGVNDLLQIGSENGNKFVRRYIAATNQTVHISDNIYPDSVWPIMFPGDTGFYFTNPTFIKWIDFDYPTAFWGI